MEVSAKELKLRLGKYLAAAAKGEVVQVTLRGRAVVELHPVARGSHERIARLVAEGRARPARGPLGPSEPQAAHYSGTEIILADRYSEQP